MNEKNGIRKVMCAILVIAIFMIIALPVQRIEAKDKGYVYLDSLEPVKTGQYTGNMGDSFIYTIGKHVYTRGNTDINGKNYKHGLEAWIARWNYTSEKSWAYSIYNIDKKYKRLEGKVVLLDSYNTTNFNTTLYFYGDGKLLTKYKMTPSNIPFNISVNVSGVKKLKIYVKDNEAVSGGTSFGIIGCKLYKATAPKTPIITEINRNVGKIKGITSKNVIVYAKVGTTTYSTKSDSKGKFVIKTKKIKKGTKVKIYAKNKYKQKSKIVVI